MADTKHKEEILLVDLSHLQGNKVYLASFKEDGTHEVNALGLNPVAWVMVNRSGLAVCSVKKPPVWAVHSISATGEASEILKIDRSKLPRTVKGDLSPDGQKICFKVESHGQWCICSLDLISGNIEEIFCNAGPISPPSWSPDGNAVAYYFGPEEAAEKDNFSIGVSHRDGKNWKHRVVSPPSQLCHRGPSRENSPLWGPEGNFLIFEGRYQAPERGPQAYIVMEDGTRLEHITRFYRSPSVVTRSRSIAYKTDAGFMTREFYEGKPQPTAIPPNGFHAKFSPSERLVAFCDENGVIRAMRSSGGKVEEIMKTGLPVPTTRFYWMQSSDTP